MAITCPVLAAAEVARRSPAPVAGAGVYGDDGNGAACRSPSAAAAAAVDSRLADSLADRLADPPGIRRRTCQAEVVAAVDTCQSVAACRSCSDASCAASSYTK